MRGVMRVPSLLAALAGIGFASAQSVPEQAPPVATGFLNKTITIGGWEHRYVVYVPRDYAKEKAWPLIVFLKEGEKRQAPGDTDPNYTLVVDIECEGLRWTTTHRVQGRPENGPAALQRATIVSLHAALARLTERR
jgi:hypothetical protein